jgi:RimJ/RimL family protein N-acetyltransferase
MFCIDVFTMDHPYHVRLSNEELKTSADRTIRSLVWMLGTAMLLLAIPQISHAKIKCSSLIIWEGAPGSKKSPHPLHLSVMTDRLIVRTSKMRDFSMFLSLKRDTRVQSMINERSWEGTRIHEARWNYQNNVRDSQDKASGFHSVTVVEKQTGTFVGSISISINQETKIGEIGYEFIPNTWGKGYATESLTAFIEICVKTFGITRFVAETSFSNLSSQRVLEKLGFVFDHFTQQDPETLYIIEQDKVYVLNKPN